MAGVRSSARRYAEAAFQVARASDSLDIWLTDLQRLRDVLADPTVYRVLTSPAVPEEERRAALDQLAPELRQQTRNLAHLLIDRGRLELVPEILQAFTELVDDFRGVVVAQVTTAIELDEELRRIVAERLSHYTGKQVRLELSVDPSLIGGVVARIGDELIDDSIRARLQHLKERLGRAPVS